MEEFKLSGWPISSGMLSVSWTSMSTPSELHLPIAGCRTRQAKIWSSMSRRVWCHPYISKPLFLGAIRSLGYTSLLQTLGKFSTARTIVVWAKMLTSHGATVAASSLTLGSRTTAATFLNPRSRNRPTFSLLRHTSSIVVQGGKGEKTVAKNRDVRSAL